MIASCRADIIAPLGLQTLPIIDILMDVQKSIGASEVGILIATFLFGVCTVQAYIYFVAERRDPLWIRLLVAFVWLLECTDTLFAWHRVYYVTVQNFGNAEAVVSTEWTLSAGSIMAGIVEALVQSFFAYRIHVLSQRWPITILLWAGSVAIVITQTVTVTIESDALLSLSQNHVWLVTATQAVLAFVDCTSTTALCYYLRIRKTGFSGTDHVINRIFIWTLQTGLITTVAALASFILSITLTNTSIWICIAVFQSKLYSNSLLASLNGRDTLRRGMEGCQEMEVRQSQSTGDGYSFPAKIMGAPISAIALSVTDNPKKRPDSDIEPNACV
ncbi:hypothetical protein FIBSPDRAFT_936504 [Athelia psychrophila]|uniref:DUF6534 domain-containing protein n=1 Tax=Athelia psychrophila TaxID=1759441 RepID=A0A166BZA4_9AGAM|nr:hypothetical protein FIBSPDRAFT_936504 [Fibularhizoctonia sp. CBS 109695]